MGFKLAFLSLALLISAASPAFCRTAKPFPQPPLSYVYNEGVVTMGVEASLSRDLADFERRTGHQFVVALFKSLDGEALEDWSNRLFRTWKVGNSKRNDGLLFALFLEDRKWRVEVGYGFEGTLTDLEAAEVVRATAQPRFKAGDYDGGVLAAVRGLEEKLAPQNATAPAPPAKGSPPTEYPFWLQPLVIAGLVLFIFAALAVNSRQQTLGSQRRYGSNAGSTGLDWASFIAELLINILASGGGGGGDGGSSWGGGDSGGGGFSGGGGSSGGGGASGSW